MSNNNYLSRLHSQYLHQSLWTEKNREYLLKIAGVNRNSRILEVGCGTGAILKDIQKQLPLCYGIDIDFPSLLFARTDQEIHHLTLADALSLPFPDHYFDLSLCHYFLLWVQDKNRALKEMIRVTRNGGAVIAFAEPDHRSRIDYPSNLEEIGHLQNLSLIKQGADITIGRKLPQIFATNGLTNIIYGVYASEIREGDNLEAHQFEWNYLRNDLDSWIDSEQIERLIESDLKAWINRQRVLYIPTFWAIGWVDH
ncbi:MAG: hypothetical protein Kow0088_06050 [Anaerolineales bacterium]